MSHNKRKSRTHLPSNVLLLPLLFVAHPSHHQRLQLPSGGVGYSGYYIPSLLALFRAVIVVTNRFPRDPFYFNGRSSSLIMTMTGACAAATAAVSLCRTGRGTRGTGKTSEPRALNTLRVRSGPSEEHAARPGGPTT